MRSVSYTHLVHRDGGIAEQRLGAGGRDLEHLVRADDRVVNVPEEAVLLRCV